MPAERIRHRCDDSDFANSIVETITPRRFAPSMRNFHQRPILSHAAEDFFKRNNNIGRPDALFLERHELDEAHNNTLFACEQAKGNNLVFVETPHYYAID